ncbi:MAG: hypothetical protein K2X09_04450 [Rickettsiales bacterium]|nr:hypothetical protein [Rickettsiales bacterium]
MTDSIADITKLVTSPASMKAEARNDGKVHIGYISGEHEDGSKCSACVAFDAAQKATIRSHRGRSEVVQIELPLTGEAFGAFAKGMGGSLDKSGMHIGGQTFKAQTPTLFAYTVDSKGQVHISNVIQGSDAIENFGTWLNDVEKNHGKVKAAAKAAGETMTQCKVAPHAPGDPLGLKAIAAAQAPACGVKR